MKRLVNVRIPVIFATAVLVGIALSYLFIYYSINLFWITAILPIVAVIIILNTVFSKKFVRITIILLTALFLIIGFALGYARLYDYDKSQLVNGANYNISANVCEKGENSSGEYIVLNNVSANNIKINGKIIVYLGSAYGDFCDVGYKVNFNTDIRSFDEFAYGKLNYYALENIKYSCNVNSGLTAKYGYSFFGNIRSHIRDTLYDNIDKDTAAITFAMITGNTQGVDDGTMSSFRYGGIAHIFAVSGLHIGILYGILCFILKKFHINRYLLAALCIAPLFFYAGVCGFTLSSIRATVMCTVSALARLAHKKYDSLNALSLSVIIILFINPLSMFSAGFQLSVCAVASIILLSKNIIKLFRKLPRSIANTLGVSLSAQAGTMPVMLTNFGYLSGAGLLLNIIILPLMSVIYALLFVSTLIAVILPFSAVILQYTCLPLQFIVSAFLNLGFEKALINNFGAGAFLPLFFISLLFLSDKINLKFIYRLTAVLCAFVFTCTYVLVRTFAPIGGYKIIVSAYFGGGSVLIRSDEGNVLIITENLSPTRTQAMLNDYYANSLSALIILGGDNCVTSYGNFDLNCKNVYVYFAYINVQPYADCTVHYESNFSVGGIEFAFSDGYSLLADCGGNKIAVCAGNYVPFDNCDLLVSDYTESKCKSEYTAGFNERNIEYNVYNCGDLVFYARNGNLEF